MLTGIGSSEGHCFKAPSGFLLRPDHLRNCVGEFRNGSERVGAELFKISDAVPY